MRPRREQGATSRLEPYLGVLRADLLGVDLWVRGDDLVPPLHLVDLRRNHTLSCSRVRGVGWGGGVSSDLLQVDRHHLAIVDEPGTLLHLDLAVQLTIDDGRVTLQTHLERAPLDVHHHVPALDAEVDVERHSQLQRNDDVR